MATSTLVPSMISTGLFMFRGNDVIFFHKLQGFKDLGHGSATRVNADQGVRVKVYNNSRINFQYDLWHNTRLPWPRATAPRLPSSDEPPGCTCFFLPDAMHAYCIRAPLDFHTLYF
jgi:hypothetical protein